MRKTDSRLRCLQMYSLNILRCKRSSSLITSKAVLITRHFNTRSIEAFVKDFVNHLRFYSARESQVWLGRGMPEEEEHRPFPSLPQLSAPLGPPEPVGLARSS